MRGAPPWSPVSRLSWTASKRMGPPHCTPTRSVLPGRPRLHGVAGPPPHPGGHGPVVSVADPAWDYGLSPSSASRRLLLQRRRLSGPGDAPQPRARPLVERLGQSTHATGSAAGRWHGPRTCCVDGAGVRHARYASLPRRVRPVPCAPPWLGVSHGAPARALPCGPRARHATGGRPRRPPRPGAGAAGASGVMAWRRLGGGSGRVCLRAHCPPRPSWGACRPAGRRAAMVDCTPQRPLVMPATRRSTALTGRPRSRWGMAGGREEPLVAGWKPRPCPPWRSPAALAALPPSWRVRELRYHGSSRGVRSRERGLVPPVRDPTCAPRDDLAALSRQRWAAETPLAQRKTPVKMDGLHCKPGLGVQKERLVCAIRSNLVRLVMLHSARRQQGDRARRRVLAALRWGSAPGTGGLLEAVLVPPVRPNRVEPRAKKRQPKQCPGMGTPRHALCKRLIQHAVKDALNAIPVRPIVPIPGSAASGTSRTPASARRLQTDRLSPAAPADRSPVLGLALPAVDRLASYPGIRTASDRHRMATETLRAVRCSCQPLCAAAGTVGGHCASDG